ncbi:RNA 2',3'-cyclic phosphodiesterase [Aquipseudomonas ullengensis]|uniref:RNA 2',3'-cyclic phosphodiesterase n=1 Tax=Aquipseudomonas ullengensis TaxID=2759166 RepID=A0A7W4LN16_9GAMM|nr:RNA 2',3'-cyclic phosphodiesterase [Pseudomonas ullengensis]MBB2496085.1 RNA 2',3'-cyclic phosphodiesterase [Pseudomonas ullengensis]
MSNKAEELHLRLFFALPLPAPLAEQLEQWRRPMTLKGQLVLPDNFHLTLAFLGAQPSSLLPRLEQLAAGLSATVFELRLEQLACWPGGLLHLAPQHIPEELLALQRNLIQRLDHAGISHDSQPYQPHVTLARHSHLPEQPAPCSITWQVREFALFVSEQRDGDPHYRAVQRWPLVAA